MENVEKGGMGVPGGDMVRRHGDMYGIVGHSSVMFVLSFFKVQTKTGFFCYQ
jgi:uncharacterized membrane protein YuzA (DUF378 family)